MWHISFKLYAFYSPLTSVGGGEGGGLSQANEAAIISVVKPGCFVRLHADISSQNWLFLLQKVRPSISFIAVTKAGILSHSMMRPNPNLRLRFLCLNLSRASAQRCDKGEVENVT